MQFSEITVLFVLIFTEFIEVTVVNKIIQVSSVQFYTLSVYCIVCLPPKDLSITVCGRNSSPQNSSHLRMRNKSSQTILLFQWERIPCIRDSLQQGMCRALLPNGFYWEWYVQVYVAYMQSPSIKVKKAIVIQKQALSIDNN